MTLDELKEMHWSQLKKAVEEAGGQYENKEQCIQFLIDAGAVTSKAEEKAQANDGSGELPTLKIPDAEQVARKTALLDRSRPFGDISGEIEGFPTARYSQGEHLFNPQGERL